MPTAMTIVAAAKATATILRCVPRSATTREWLIEFPRAFRRRRCSLESLDWAVSGRAQLKVVRRYCRAVRSARHRMGCERFGPQTGAACGQDHCAGKNNDLEH